MIYPETISKEELAQLPRAEYPGRIVVVNDRQDLEQWLPLLLREPIVGFDTETKPTFKKGQSSNMALLQLATAEVALLIRVQQVGLPQELIHLFSNPHIHKVGAAIHDDIKLLQKLEKFNPQGFVDLQNVLPEYGITSISVQKMTGIVLGLRVSKSQQLSNWEQPQLTDAQQQYAAVDAWVCKEVYQKLLVSRIRKLH